jgi:hypothetical protein
MVVSNRQRGGNFKGSKHQRSKPKKQETPKQEGGWLDWLVPPLAIARIAREKKAKKRREMMRRKRMERMSVTTNPDYSANNNYRYARPRQQGGSWWPEWIAPKPTNQYGVITKVVVLRLQIMREKEKYVREKEITLK